MPILALLLLLAPEGTVELKLRFEKGMVYEDASTSRVKLRLTEQKKLVRFDVEADILIRRTVLEVGTDGLPSAEKVEVVRFAKKVHEAPDREAATESNPAEGKTFLWRRREKEDGYALFADDAEVTAEHPRLAERLLSWRAKRMPEKPVAIGATWEVAASEFLAATGQPVPPDLQGVAVFKLEEVKENVARISFEVKSSCREGGRDLTGVQRGTWLFDIARGREISLEAAGSMEFDRLERGDGSFKMTRTLTYR